MYRERGYLHRYDTGHVVLTPDGVGIVEGVRILRKDGQRIIAYFILLDGGTDQTVIAETDILGFCLREERGRRQTETLPLKGDYL